LRGEHAPKHRSSTEAEDDAAETRTAVMLMALVPTTATVAAPLGVGRRSRQQPCRDRSRNQEGLEAQHGFHSFEPIQ
jgi:hypothetical protein